MNLARLKLVTFDVTDTLLQFRMALGKQYSEVGALHGVHCDENALAANFKTHWYQMKKSNPNFGKYDIGWIQWWKLIVYKTFKDADLNADDKKLDLIANDLINMYMEAHCWQQCHGALGILSYLRNRGVAIGILSNFDERLPNLLENTRLRHYFKFVLTSYEAGFEKPDIRIFSEAILRSKIPNLKPTQCLHVGDTVALDYIGAIQAGWNAALIDESNISTNLEKYKQVDLRHVYRNLYDLHKDFVDCNSKE